MIRAEISKNFLNSKSLRRLQKIKYCKAIQHDTKAGMEFRLSSMQKTVAAPAYYILLLTMNLLI